MTAPAATDDALSRRVTCPVCEMLASRADHRLLAPVDGRDPSARRCRNCSAVLDVSGRQPRLIAPMS